MAAADVAAVVVAHLLCLFYSPFGVGWSDLGFDVFALAGAVAGAVAAFNQSLSSSSSFFSL